MSKQKLAEVLNSIIKRLENSKKEIREDVADKRGQRLRITNTDLRFQIESFLREKGFEIDSAQSAEINKAITEFTNSVFSSFRTKKGYRSDIKGTSDDFVIEVLSIAASGSVFKLALRQQLNPYLEKLETKVAKIAQGDEKLFVRGLANESGISKTKGFLNLGHTDQSSISAIGPALSISSSEKAIVTQNYYEDLNFALTKYGFFNNPGTFMELELERSSANFATSTKEERNRLQTITKELRGIVENLDFANIEGSPSLLSETREAFENALQGKPEKKRAPSKAIQKRKKKLTIQESSLKLDMESPRTSVKNWLSIINIINSKLPEVVRSNMGEPSLVNRTGAFSESARVTNIFTTPQGFPSIGFTYNKTPYGVFDPRIGAAPWATPARNPNVLIERSIRQIASELAIGRFYLRRQ